jgi:hypothetical protein
VVLMPAAGLSQGFDYCADYRFGSMAQGAFNYFFFSNQAKQHDCGSESKQEQKRGEIDVLPQKKDCCREEDCEADGGADNSFPRFHGLDAQFSDSVQIKAVARISGMGAADAAGHAFFQKSGVCFSAHARRGVFIEVSFFVCPL